MRKLNFKALSVLMLLAAACATNPLTGRQSLSLISNAQLFPQSFSQYSQVLKDNKVDKTSDNAKKSEQCWTTNQICSRKVLYRNR